MPDENGDPYGYELLFAVGTITTLDTDEDFLDEIVRERFPFGFQAPQPNVQPPDMPELSSHDWGRWLDDN